MVFYSAHGKRTLSTVLHWLLVGIFGAGLLYAAVSDLRTLVIPNWLNLTLAGLFAPAAYLAGFDPMQILQQYGVAMGFLAAGLVLFALKVMGGGDVKMLAAIAPWIEASKILPFLIGVSIAGGVLALMIIALRRLPADAVLRRWLPWLEDGAAVRQQPVPYGVAIAAAALWLLPGLDVVSMP